jgi:L-rhamnose-H+ transport protein
MLYNEAILPFITAGIMNGSFIIPARYIKKNSNEKIWFYHSIIGLGIIPWVMLAFILPNVIQHYLSLNSSILILLILSGVIFGLGQVCFAYAIELIGIALSFTINLSLGVTIGSLFVVLYKSALFTTQGLLVSCAILLIITSLIIYYYASKNHSFKNINYGIKSHHRLGWVLACLTGFTSGLQNIAFVVIAFHAKTQFQINNSFWVWPPFLLAAAIPMLFGFRYKISKNKVNGFNYINRSLSIKNLFLITLMGLLFTGSLALYSNGMSNLNHQQQVIGWPAFMVSIILASQIWGWLYGESASVTKSNKFYMVCSLGLLILAIIILAMAT